MIGLAPHRRRLRDRGDRLDQVGRRVGGTADLAAIAVLIGRSAARAGAAHIAVGQKHAGLLIVGLAHRAPRDVAAIAQRVIDRAREAHVFRRMSAVELIKSDQKTGVIAPVLLRGARDQRLGTDAFLLCPDHDRRAVRILGAAVDAVIATHLLEAHPDVGLHRLHDVTQVQRGVGVGQGAGDEDFSWHEKHYRTRCQSRGCPTARRAVY